ncbi:MAG: hypothetical protein JST67_01220 [Bacteroidetes bacterium]|nr:hypothetical protein [Bacteroidota bacterium]
MRIKKFILFLTVITSLFACSSNENEENMSDTAGAAEKAVIEEQKINAQNVFNSIPGPNELSEMVTQTNLDYDISLTNDPMNLNKYTSDDAKALVLGIYGGDMVYANTYEQTQESMSFLKCLNSLCRSLGITDAFDDKTADRLQANRDNKDSLLTIVSKSFNRADAFLRENQRPGTSALMVAGGWIEGLYLSGKLAEKSKNRRLIQKMSQQKKSIADLIQLIQNGKIASGASYVLTGLQDIQNTYNKISDTEPMSEAQLSELNNKVFALRAKMVAV